MAHTRILVVEDDSMDAAALKARLEATGCRILGAIDAGEIATDFKFEDLFNLEDIQKIQDAFAAATGVASIITDPQGQPITKPSNFCGLCQNIIRKTEKGLSNCQRSDAALGRMNPDGPILQACLSCGLWDGGASIQAGGRHIGNWLIGQVLDDSFDSEKLMAYAREIGADETAFREALGKVSRMPKGQFEKVCQALFLIAGHLSRLAQQNVEQARYISECRRLEDQLRQAQKMEAVGQLAGGVAHDFNNILSTILLHLYMLKAEPGITPSIHGQLSELEAEARRAAELTRQLLLFSRRQNMRSLRVDMNEILAGLMKMLGRLLGEHIVLQLQPCSQILPIQGDPGMMEQVMMNLCLNARDAMPNGGRLVIRTKTGVLDAKSSESNPDAQAGEFVCLEVSDTGFGMDKATQQRIFEPFFTTKEAGKGTGLGLATIYGIVKQHKGWIQVESAPGQGSTFSVFFPAYFSPAQEETVLEVRSLQGGTETILLVEDEAGVRQMMTSCLKRHGYRVLQADNGVHALAIWERHRDEIALLFTDIVMPEGVSGLELAKNLKQDKGGLKIIITSGYSDEAFLRGVPSQEGVIFLPKPYEPDVLIETIRKCLDH